MPRPEPTLAERARGTLLGLAAGDALARPAGPGATPASPFAAGPALALLLADELLEPEVDLRRLADRWIRWLREDGRGIEAGSRAALEHIAEHDSPPGAMAGPVTADALARALPVALATFRSPRNLVSGTWHTVALTHPDPRCAWGAVAVNVAAARFLSGYRDFISDVIEALRNNDAPAELLAAVRRVPVERREEIVANARDAAPVVLCVEYALWAAYHEPALEPALLRSVAVDGGVESLAALAGGLLGARDGEGALPPAWVAALPRVPHLRAVAERLVGAK
ncbi:MAG: ADP-ribosylglycohydrolase family protein [Gemmatimonadales bacterium]